MNKDSYNALPDDLKAVIDANSGFETSAMAGRAHDTGDRDGRTLMEDAGNEIATLSEVETARIVELGNEVTQEWIAEMADRGLNAAQLVEDARAAVEATRGAESETDG